MFGGIYAACIQNGKPLLLLVFGFLSMGVAFHGPLFMGQYANFLSAIVAFEEEPEDPETIREILDLIGSGELDSTLQDVAVRFVVGQSLADAAGLIATAIDEAPNDAGREALQELNDAYQERMRERQLATALVESWPNAQNVVAFENALTSAGVDIGELDGLVQAHEENEGTVLAF